MDTNPDHFTTLALRVRGNKRNDLARPVMGTIFLVIKTMYKKAKMKGGLGWM